MNKNRGRWTKKDDDTLAAYWRGGEPVKVIAQLMGRTQAAVSTRLTTLRKRGVAGLDRRGKSPGAPAGARKSSGQKNVSPTGEDAETQARRGKSMAVPSLFDPKNPSAGAIKSLREKVERLKDSMASARQDAAVAHRRVKTLENALEFAQGKLDKGFASEEFMLQLQRENAALRKALVASNEVILVYTARGEDSA